MPSASICQPSLQNGCRWSWVTGHCLTLVMWGALYFLALTQNDGEGGATACTMPIALTLWFYLGIHLGLFSNWVRITYRGNTPTRNGSARCRLSGCTQACSAPMAGDRLWEKNCKPRISAMPAPGEKLCLPAESRYFCLAALIGHAHGNSTGASCISFSLRSLNLVGDSTCDGSWHQRLLSFYN
jgi:hypothetical protein